MSATSTTTAVTAATSSSSETNLLEFLDKKGTHALNEAKGHSVENVFKPGNDSYLESDCDEQLIAYVWFHYFTTTNIYIFFKKIEL